MLPKWERFAQEYIVCGNATEAARRVGYKGADAKQRGYRLMQRPEVVAMIAEGAKKAAQKAEITAERVMEELGRVAFLSAAELFDAEGNLIPIKDLPAHVAAAIHPTEVLKRNLEAGDGVTDTVHRVRVHDKLKALELLGKKLNMFTDKLEVSGKVELTDHLRERYANAKR